MKHAERGSAIIVLFVLVALFGLLSFAFLQGSGNNVSWLQKEKNNADTTRLQDCTNAVSMGRRRLELKGCGNLISIALDGSNTNPGAPVDGSCSIFHPAGGGVKPCTDPTNTDICMPQLQIGESCGGVIYFGTLSGKRLYTTPTDTPSVPFNNGTTSFVTPTFANSNTDGMANTNALVAAADAEAPYRAAQACRALGPKWYLPAPAELQLLQQSRNVGALVGTTNTQFYWTSRGQGTNLALCIIMADGSSTSSNKSNVSRSIRCVRSD